MALMHIAKKANYRCAADVSRSWRRSTAFHLFRTRFTESLGRNMKTTHLLAALIAATLPITAVLAEDTAKTETTDQKQEQSSDTTGMKGMMTWAK